MARFGLVLLLALSLALPAAGQFAVTWDGTFNATPADVDLVGEGDDRIRELKLAITERMEVQHQFSTVTGVDTGRHREGSAWLLRVAAGLDCSGEAILVNDEEGRLCFDDDDNSLWVADNNAGGNWHRANAVPQHAIILWDQATGDEFCTGGAVAGECPCGFSEATEFRGLTVRGADTILPPAFPDIPDVPGESCTGDGGMGTCTATVGMYDDNLEINELPEHTHDITTVIPASAGDAGYWWTNPAYLFGVGATLPTGNDEPHYHPFRTVLFCRKN